MKKLFLLAASMAALVGPASAAMTAYTDRDAFEAALASVTRDDFNDLTVNGGANVIDRGAYVMDGSFYQCVVTGCNSNESQGASLPGSYTYPAYVWHYMVNHTVTFDVAQNGFGFDFSNYVREPANTVLTIEGMASPTNSGFFGVISDVAMTTFDYSFSGTAYMITDNFTYGSGITSAAVPVPAAAPLMLAGLGLAAWRRKKA